MIKELFSKDFQSRLFRIKRNSVILAMLINDAGGVGMRKQSALRLMPLRLMAKIRPELKLQDIILMVEIYDYQNVSVDELITKTGFSKTCIHQFIHDFTTADGSRSDAFFLRSKRQLHTDILFKPMPAGEDFIKNILISWNS